MTTQETKTLEELRAAAYAACAAHQEDLKNDPAYRAFDKKMAKAGKHFGTVGISSETMEPVKKASKSKRRP